MARKRTIRRRDKTHQREGAGYHGQTALNEFARSQIVYERYYSIKQIYSINFSIYSNYSIEQTYTEYSNFMRIFLTITKARQRKEVGKGA